MILVVEKSDEVVFMLDSGVRFTVSPEDKMLVLGQRWTKDCDGYIKCVGARCSPIRQKRLHACIFGHEMDHKDGDLMNNRRDNLRPATKSQQAANRKRAITNQSGFKGVIARRGRWQARIKKNGHCMYSPLYNSPQEAHDWYVSMATVFHGEFARTE